MMKRKSQSSYKKLFKKISKRISGIFSKKKIVKHHRKKESNYISFLKNIFKKSKKGFNKTKKLKNAKIFISSVLCFIFAVTVFSFLQKKDQPTNEDNLKQNINYDFMHGAATGRDFLFEGETGHDSNLTVNTNQETSGQKLYVGTTTVSNTGSTQSGGRSTTGLKYSNNNTGKNILDIRSTGININTGLVTGNNINTPAISENPNVIILPVEISKYLIRKLKDQIKQQKLLAETVKKDCVSPRNTTVKNGDFIITYQQRTDVNNFCNVERRYCIDGSLGGTYTQEKCDENAKYEYQTAEVKSYIEKPNESFTQPSKPINNSATFSTDGKINTSNTSNTNRGYSQDGAQTTNEKETGLKYISNPSDCKDPRGNVLKNGQFVTAYKTPIGFIDLECKSEYRYCTNGKLGGSYSYKECKYKDITYNDYLVGNTDTDKATTLDLMGSINPEEETDSENIRSKIESLFR